MQSDDAAATLRAASGARRRTRRALNPSWFSNLVFGAFFVGTALVSTASEGVALAYWIAGGVGAFTATFWFHVRVERELGVEAKAWDSSATLLVALLAGVVVANVLFEGDLQVAMPLFAGALGLLGFALLWGDVIEGAAAAGIAAVATAVLVIGPEWAGWGNLGLGVVLLAAGAVAWRR